MHSKVTLTRFALRLSDCAGARCYLRDRGMRREAEGWGPSLQCVPIEEADLHGDPPGPRYLSDISLRWSGQRLDTTIKVVRVRITLSVDE